MNPIDDTISALTALWRDAPTLTYQRDGVTTPLLVTDGPLLEDTDQWRVLSVGTGAQYLPASTDARRGVAQGGRSSYSLPVQCELRVWSGDADTGHSAADMRRQGLGVLHELTRLVAARRDLNGTVDWARVTTSSYQPLQVPAGAAALISFTVAVDATRFDEEE